MHTLVWAAIAKEMVKSTKDPELRELLLAHAKAYDDGAKLAKAVPYCTVQLQHDKQKAIVRIHIRPELEELWFRMKQTMFLRGGSQFFGPAPRGPLARQLLAMRI